MPIVRANAIAFEDSKTKNEKITTRQYNNKNTNYFDPLMVDNKDLGFQMKKIKVIIQNFLGTSNTTSFMTIYFKVIIPKYWGILLRKVF